MYELLIEQQAKYVMTKWWAMLCIEQPMMFLKCSGLGSHYYKLAHAL